MNQLIPGFVSRLIIGDPTSVVQILHLPELCRSCNLHASSPVGGYAAFLSTLITLEPSVSSATEHLRQNRSAAAALRGTKVEVLPVNRIVDLGLMLL